ncbi:hypothetical protein EAS64_16390 [Trebonia kvetii]|uniref:Uncharacterized protein n=1 Tax=Trebonia kvetii TaxID=2480626 RepID=A0A6P2BYJ9_9ACTN|nr:hypothetical protein EAS64_16390 [Trebonia kvetii]
MGRRAQADLTGAEGSPIPFIHQSRSCQRTSVQFGFVGTELPDDNFNPSRPHAARVYDYLLGGKVDVLHTP